MNPKVSIIVPVYNVANYLPQCLDSLISQTFVDIEIICFNDASTDNSLEILQIYAKKDPRIKIIDSKVNIKQGGGRNQGIKTAKADYIMFVDSDDWVSPKFVESLYNTAVITNADICTADYYEVINSEKKEISLLGKNIFNDTDSIKKTILTNGCRLVTSIFKRKLFFENNLFFPEKTFYEDNAIGAALFLSAKLIIKINEEVYYYRINTVSTTRSRNNYHFFDRIESSLLMLQNARRVDKKEHYKEYYEDYFVKLIYINTILGAINKFDTLPIDYIKKARKMLKENVGKDRISKTISSLNLWKKIIINFSLVTPYLLFPFHLIKNFLNILKISNKFKIG